MNTITRGTTPLIKIKVKNLSSISVEELWLTFVDQYKGIVIDLTKDDVAIDEDYISVRLSQEQTLSIKSDKVLWQLRLVDTSGIAYSSGPARPIDINKILKDGVIS